ncbi:MAG: hypothetical protein KDD62_15330, partial [Bdellovibrionales bacterium]|nr:hypothetical protein [Bdellovibrionales bacterium]
KIVEAGHLNIVFEKLNQIPEYALEVLEKGYYLQSYKKDIGITSEEVYQAYRKVQQKGDSLEVAKFVSDIQAMKRRIISAEAIPPQLFAHPLYPVIVKFVYPANQGHGELFQSAGTFPDRTSDLQAFKVRSSYTINTYEGSEMVIKEGSSVDAKARAQIEGPIVAAQERLGSVNFNIEEMRALLDKELAGEIKISRNFKTREERLLGSFLAAQKGDIPMDKVKRFLLMYQFTEYENIQDYLEGTRQKVEKTKHPDYAHLLELHEYYHDKVHDALQGLLDSLREQGRVQKFLPDFFEKFELRRRSEHRQDVVNRHRPVKLGWTDSLAMQIERIKAKEDQPGQKPKDEIIENIISKEKARIAAFVADLTGEELSVEAIDLKTFDAAHYLKLYEDEAKGPWNLDMIFSNVGQMFRTAFHDELRAIKSEMSKYIPEDAKPG